MLGTKTELLPTDHDRTNFTRLERTLQFEAKPLRELKSAIPSCKMRSFLDQ